jgi:hypothetical protein
VGSALGGVRDPAEESAGIQEPLTAKRAKRPPRTQRAPFFATFVGFLSELSGEMLSRDKIPAQLFQAYADHDRVTARD